ncbi:hypothetical protein [Hoeflea marina]|uniref:hypothetical protein n=1 Tax=Hoeflea marina TaxID=274592 RepID=UPI0011B3CC82|nr:hypothetical protein [Hoeflea marina]
MLKLAFALAAVAGISAANAECPPRQDNPNASVSGIVGSTIAAQDGVGIRPDGCNFDIIVTNRNMTGLCEPGAKFSATGEYVVCQDYPGTGDCFELIGDTMYQSRVICEP